ELAQRGIARKIETTGRRGGNLIADRTLSFRSDEHDRKSLPQEMPREFGKPFAAPMLGLPDGSRRDRYDSAWFVASVSAKLPGGTFDRHVGNGKREIGCALVEAEHGAKSEVSVDGVHIERGHRDPMRIGNPCSFAGALPGMLAGLRRKRAAGRRPHLRA